MNKSYSDLAIAQQAMIAAFGDPDHATSIAAVLRKNPFPRHDGEENASGRTEWDLFLQQTKHAVMGLQKPPYSRGEKDKTETQALLKTIAQSALSLTAREGSAEGLGNIMFSTIMEELEKKRSQKLR